MKRAIGLILGTAIVVAAVSAAGWLLWPSRQTGGADSGDARQVALGATVYREHCARCHGAALEGQPDWRTRNPDGRLPAPPHDASGHTWHHTDDQLFRMTKLGMKPPLAPEGYQSDMPAFSAVLTDAQIWAVLAFIESRWPAELQARRSARLKGAVR